MAPRILIADDDESMRWVLSKTFCPPEYLSDAVANAGDALQKLRESEYDALLMDIRMPGMSGLEALSQAKLLQGDLAVIIITAYGTMTTAIEAMKWGAYDYITKPFDVEKLELTVQRALKTRALARENKELRANLRRKYDLHNLVGSSETMQQVYKTIGRVADTDVTVLIQGESGTGKEMVARAIHYNGRRSSGSFVPVNCVAIPENLLESEMFGHVKGAFTGATANRVGKFEQAEGGTLFLDEVADIGLDLQGKLLRVLQEREIEPVGGEGAKKVNVRVIAATNRDLSEQLRRREFREDLFYRLNVVPIELPSLRERREDIPELVSYFVERFADEMNIGPRMLEPAAIDVLRSYDWPGNVRELENLVKRIMVTQSDQAITPEHIALAMPRQAVETVPALRSSWDEVVGHELQALKNQPNLYERLLEKLEKPLITKVLENCGGNQLKAAGVLGINRNTLHKKMKKLGLK